MKYCGENKFNWAIKLFMYAIHREFKCFVNGTDDVLVSNYPVPGSYLHLNFFSPNNGFMLGNKKKSQGAWLS